MTTPRREPAPGRQSVGANLRALRAAQKPSAGTALYSRMINRPIGRVFAAVGARWGLTPNAISLISAAFSFTGIALIATRPASWGLALAITAALVVGYALDSADGQVARLTDKGSPLGEWLDHMIDCTKIAALHTALAWHVVTHTTLGRGWLLVPLAYTIVAIVMFFGMILTDQLRRAGGIPKPTGSATGADLLKSLLVLPSDYGFLCLSFLAFGATSLFFPLYAAFLAGNALLLIAAVVKWVRQLASLNPGSPS